MSLSSSGCIIDQIIALAYDPSEVIEFLSTKKGFERVLYAEIARHYFPQSFLVSSHQFSSDYSSKIVFTLPVVHVVAAKQFETAEEAEEWLGYVVHRMGDGSINKLERVSIFSEISFFFIYLCSLRMTLNVPHFKWPAI